MKEAEALPVCVSVSDVKAATMGITASAGGGWVGGDGEIRKQSLTCFGPEGHYGFWRMRAKEEMLGSKDFIWFIMDDFMLHDTMICCMNGFTLHDPIMLSVT